MRTTFSFTEKRALNNVHGLIVILSVDGEIGFVNDYTLNLLGYKRKEMMGKNWFDHFVPKMDRSKLKNRFNSEIKNKENKCTADYIETKNGEWHLIEWHNTFIHDRHNKIIAVFLSGEDVTEKKLLRLYLTDLQSKYREQHVNAVIESAERERKFIAYELHDGVNQVLTTCKLLLESEIKTGNKSLFVGRVHCQIQEVINMLRELSHQLNPADLGNEGLHQSTLDLVANINATNKVEVRTEIKGVRYMKNLAAPIGISLLRIMQEAITNIVKHAGAKHVHIALIASKTAVDLEIKDDGKGFDRKSQSAGLGFRTIYTRANASGGKACIMSTLGEGTEISVHIPLICDKI